MRAIFRLLVLTIAFDFCTAGPGARAHVGEAPVRGTPAFSSRAPAQTHVPPHHTPDSLNYRTTNVISLPYSMELRRRRGMVPTVAESRRRTRRRRAVHATSDGRTSRSLGGTVSNFAERGGRTGGRRRVHAASNGPASRGGMVYILSEPRRRIRRRRSTRASGTRVQHRIHEDRQFRQRGDFPLYLSSNSTGEALELAPQNSTHDNHTRFRLHFFDLMTLDADSGEVVVMQTHDGGHFVHADSSGNLSLLAGEGDSISNVEWVDNRFFLLHAVQGDTSHQIKHLLTGRYLSAGEDGVNLVTSDQGVSDDMLFDMFSCS